jgi:hypothetical protein
VTVSGPPARLKHIFLKSDYFRGQRFVALPVYAGLCHASHVYNEEHICSIVQTSSLDALNVMTVPRVSIFSTSSGKPFKAKTAKDLFHQIVEEILTQPIQWDKVSDFPNHCVYSGSHTFEFGIRIKIPRNAIQGFQNDQLSSKNGLLIIALRLGRSRYQ